MNDDDDNANCNNNAMIVDVEKEEGELEEGEIDLDLEPGEKANDGNGNVCNSDELMNVNGLEVEFKEEGLQLKLNGIHEALESVTVTEANK